MFALTSRQANRRWLLSLVLLNFTSSAARALEPTPIDNLDLKLSVLKRTDASVQQDLAAVKAFLAQQRTEPNTDSVEEPNTSVSISPAPMSSPSATEPNLSTSQPTAPKDLALPKYDTATVDSVTPKADEAATVRPAIATSDNSNMPSVAPAYHATIDECGVVTYHVINDPCLPVAESTAKEVTAEKPNASTSILWTDEMLTERVKQLSGGSIVIGTLEEAAQDRQTTSGYRGTSDQPGSTGDASNVDRKSASSAHSATAFDVLPDLSPSALTVLPPPIYTRANSLPVYSTSVGYDHLIDARETLVSVDSETRIAFSALDAEAAVQPALVPAPASLGSSDLGVAPAAFQQGGFAVPGSSSPAVPPPAMNSSGAVPGLGGSNSVLPQSSTIPPSLPFQSPAPSAANAPSVTPFPSGSSSGSPVPYDSMPQYPRTAPVVTGEPFVTEGPCQFDAYQMVTPVVYNATQVPGSAPQCGPLMPQPAVGSVQPMTGLPGFYAPPTVMPNQAPSLYSSGNAGHRPLLGFGQENYNVQIGRGIIGQPVAYVPGQSIRNFFRYLFP